MKPPLVSRRLALAAACVVSLPAVGRAAEEPTLELPKYTVTTGRELPPPERWHYARIDGFEVLSSSGEGASRKLVRDFNNFAYAVDLVWPGLRSPSGLPAALVICAQSSRFNNFLPAGFRPGEQVVVSSYHGDQAALVLDVQNKILAFKVDNASAPVRAAAIDPGAAITGPEGLTIDSYQELYREYIRFLLSRQATQPPPWLAEGLTQLLMNLHITATEISVGRVENPNEADSKPVAQDFNAALDKRHLLPLDEMLAAHTDGNVASDLPWAKQCYAFVHWGLYGDYGKHQQAFLTFVHRLDREPPTEAMFKECLKQDYAEMLQSLRNHIDSTRFKYAGVRSGKGEKIPWPPAAALRVATQAEVGRLQATAFTLAERPGEARDALLTAYLRGERDPALLGDLGVAEAKGGDPAKARQLLEAAAAANVVRPSAYVELARLRLAAARGKPEATAGKLSVKQTAAVLEPLFTARRQPPALPETYELIAAAWAASISSPAPAHLAVLDEGVRLFPRDAALVYADAELQARAGQIATADSLIRHGLRVTTDADLQARFEHLRAGLPPAPPTPAKG